MLVFIISFAHLNCRVKKILMNCFHPTNLMMTCPSYLSSKNQMMTLSPKKSMMTCPSCLSLKNLMMIGRNSTSLTVWTYFWIYLSEYCAVRSVSICYWNLLISMPKS